MFSNDDHSGLAALLLCLVIVVMGGVFLSLMIDGNVRFSKDRRMLDEELHSGAEEISHLHHRLAALETRLMVENEGRGESREALDRTRSLAGSTADRKRGLEKSKQLLVSDLANVDAAFAAYRGGYREQHRKEAVGRRMGVLRLRNGREFQQVVITRVTPGGLEIRHESGTARLDARDLEDRLQDEFQWDDPASGAGVRSAPVAGVVSPPAASVRPPAAGNPKTAELQVLQERVRASMAKARNLKSQRDEASSKASFGSSKSVPGSLETWAQRAESLGARVIIAEQELARARAALAAQAPNDPLLTRPSD